MCPLVADRQEFPLVGRSEFSRIQKTKRERGRVPCGDTSQERGTEQKYGNLQKS